MSDTVTVVAKAGVDAGEWSRRVAGNIQAELARHGLNQKWLATQLGMNEQTLSVRVRVPPVQAIETEVVGRSADAIAAHTGESRDTVWLRLNQV